MATHSSILAWRIPWAEEPGRLQSMGLQRVGHNLVIKQQQMCFTLGWVWKPRIPLKKKRKEKLWIYPSFWVELSTLTDHP